MVKDPEVRRRIKEANKAMAFCQPTKLDLVRGFFSRETMSDIISHFKTKLLHLVRGPPTPAAELILARFTFELPVDPSLPCSYRCFEAIANEHHAGQLSYEEFLEGALAHLEPTSPIRHPEDDSLANLAKLSNCGSLGPVAAAIKLCMLSDSDEKKLTLLYNTVALLHAIQPPVSSNDHHPLPTTPSALSSLHLQVIILTALIRKQPALAIELLSADPPPAPPKHSLFNLRDSAVCPVGRYANSVFRKFPIEFWTAAVRAGWVAPSPEIATTAVSMDEGRGSPLLHVLLDAGLDVTTRTEYGSPLYNHLLSTVVQKLDDPSLLRDIIAGVPPKKLKAKSDLLRLAVADRQEGGVEMLAMLLDHGLDINYRSRDWVPLYVQRDPWGDLDWWKEHETALHTAAREGHRDAVRFLISRGAKLNEPDYHKRTARELAVDKGHLEVVEIFDEVEKTLPDGKKG